MRPSEAAIATSIETLSAGRFQRLAECYAQVRYPQRFRDLIPRGRTATDQTRAGWGDGCVYLPDGRVDVLEATKDPRWKRHLAADLEKASALGESGLAGFVFVAWAATPSPDELKPWYGQLRRLGVPEDRLALVFKDELTRSLSEPAYADVWSSILDLPASAHPFVLLDRAPVYGGGKLDQFVPTRDEHVDGSVHRPATVDRVETRLAEERWAFVRGRGAAGKTVLAVLIGLNESYRGAPVYYLDLAASAAETQGADTRTAFDVIASRAAPNVLFILDNVHRDESTARTIFDYWRDGGGESHMLLLGRWTERGMNLLGLAGSLDDMNPDAIPLKVESPDLLGVYARLAKRVGYSAPKGEPSPETLARWKDTFAGDLVAFSFAVATKLKGAPRADGWALEPADAREYVREQYLSGLDDAERAALETLATLSTLEVPVSSELIDPSALKSSLRDGLVLRVDADGAVPLYQLVHPGIGQLLLDGLGLVDEVDDRLLELASDSPHTGLQIAARLEAEDRRELAAQVVRRSLDGEGDLLRAVASGGLGTIAREISLAVRLGAMEAHEIDEEIADRMTLLVQGLVAAPLASFVSFLVVARRYLPMTREALLAAMEEEPHFRRIQAAITEAGTDARAVTSLMIQAASLDRYDELLAALREPSATANLVESLLRLRPKILRRHLRASRKAPGYGEFIREALASKESAPVLGRYLVANMDSIATLLDYGSAPASDIGHVLERALRSRSLRDELFAGFRRGELVAIEDVAQAIEPYRPAFRDELLDQLEDPDFVREAIEARLRGTGAPLIRLLKHTWGPFPSLARRILDELRKPEYVVLLASACRAGDLGDARRLLTQLKPRLPIVVANVMGRLTSPSDDDWLREQIAEASEIDLERFVTLAEGRVLRWLCDQPEDFDDIVSAATRRRLLPSLARAFKSPELQEYRAAVAAGLFDLHTVDAWARSTMSIDHLAAALVLGRDHPLAARLAWLERLLSRDEWADARMTLSKPRVVVTPLLNIWLTQEARVIEELRAHLDADGFDASIQSLIRNPEPGFGVVRLIGVGRLFGLSPSTLDSCDTDLIYRAIRRVHRTNKQWLTHAQMETWIGVRALSEWTGPFRLPVREGRAAMTLLEKSRYQTERERLLQASVAEWLGAACDDGWWIAAGAPFHGHDVDPELLPVDQAPPRRWGWWPPRRTRDLI